MCKLRFQHALLPLIFTALLIGCGDLDVLSGARSYKVIGLVDGVSLDECAVIKSDSQIQPYFDCNISNDTDTAALYVVIKNQLGKVEGAPYRYILPERPKVFGENGDAEDENAENSTEETSNGSNEALNGDGSGNSDPTSTETGKPGAQADNSPSGDEKKQETSDKTDQKTDDPASGDSDKTVGVENENLQANNETDFEDENATAEGKTDETLANGETEPSAEAKEPMQEDIVIAVKQFGDELPPFSFPANAPSGFYTITFTIIGNSGEILHSSEKPVFYLAAKSLVIEDVKSYLSGVSETPYIVPPETLVLLEARIKIDASFKPYIIWYSGKTSIAEGEVIGGVHRFLWKSPTQTGFQALRAEVFPFNPRKHELGIRGVSREMSLPISLRHGRHSYFSDRADQFARWYEFWGNVNDSKDPQTPESALVPAQKQNPLWLPKSGSFGLALGSPRVWTLPGEPFALAKDGKSAAILMRFAPRRNGIILSTTFTDDDTGITQAVKLAIAEHDLILSTDKQGAIASVRLPIITDDEGFAVAALDFQFLEASLVISAALEHEGAFIDWQSIELTGNINKKTPLAFGYKSNDSADTSIPAILTELALLYPDGSLVPVESEEDADDDDDANNELALSSGDATASRDIDSL
jgi:hypothetical protein